MFLRLQWRKTKILFKSNISCYELLGHTIKVPMKILWQMFLEGKLKYQIVKEDFVWESIIKSMTTNSNYIYIQNCLKYSMSRKTFEWLKAIKFGSKANILIELLVDVWTMGSALMSNWMENIQLQFSRHRLQINELDFADFSWRNEHKWTFWTIKLRKTHQNWLANESCGPL